MKLVTFKLGIVLVLLSVTANAQQPQRPSDEELNAMIQTLAGQRNAANDQIVRLAGQLAVLEAKLKAAGDAAKVCKPEKGEK